MSEKGFGFKELQEANLIYFHGDSLASDVWINKYALKNKDLLFDELTPSDMFIRLTKEIHRKEQEFPNPMSYDEIYENLKDFKYFVFGGSILFGLGNDYQTTSLGNCFFIDNGADSYGGIFNIDECIAQLMKRRGGVGITLEHLRPRNISVNNAAQTSTGAISYMDRFSNTTREVAQDGRRGALIITLSSDYLNIKEFITKKDDLSKVTGANISIKISDEFMNAVENNKDYFLRWPIDKKVDVKDQLIYNKVYEIDGIYVMKVKAKEIWDMIIKQAHKNAEPGVLFWDTIIRESLADCYKDFGFESKGVNPCSEIILSKDDACRLGSINLNNIILNPYTKDARVDFDLLERVSRFSQRVMDDIVELEEEKMKCILAKIESDPEPPEIKRTEYELWGRIIKNLKLGRRTGVGIFGLADMFAKLNIRYASQDAIDLSEKIFKKISVSCYKESVNLAKERGAFPIWNAKLESKNPFIIRIIKDIFDDREYNDYLKYGRRNITCTTCPPTGSLSVLSQTSSGIEPVFKIYHKRRRKINPNDKDAKVFFVDNNEDSWEEYNVIHGEFINWYSFTHGSSYEISKDILQNLNPKDFDELITTSPWAESESHMIDPIKKIDMIGVIQKYIDQGISQTCNLPENVSLEEVSNIYFHAWKVGCKGMTIYREGSRSGVLLSSNKDKNQNDFEEHDAPKRPKELIADYYIATAKGKKFAVIIGLYNKKPYEIFAFENPQINDNCKGKIIKIKKGHYIFESEKGETIENIHLAAELVEERAHTMFLSMLLRHGAGIKHIINVAKKVDDNITSFSSVCRRMLSKYIQDEIMDERCPECGSMMIRQEGCVHCQDCSYSKCL